MPLIRANTVIQYVTGLPADVISNTMWFNATNSDPFETNCDAIAADLETFYAAVYALGRPSYFQTLNTISTNFYDMSTPTPRVPYNVPLATTGWGSGTASNIPTEVAAVLSYHATPESGISAARLRGRIYIGGLVPTMLANGTGSGTTTFPTLSSAFITDLTDAADALKTARLGADGQWSTYSSVSGVIRPVFAGWVDNSPDTQRRRSVEATARTTWP